MHTQNTDDSDKLKERIALFIVVTVGFLVKIYHLSEMSVYMPFRADALQYAQTAMNIANHGIFAEAFSGDNLTINRLPGYPLLLSIIWKFSQNTQSFYSNSLFANVILGTASVALIFLVARKKFPLYASLTLSFLLIFNPHVLSMEGYILTETLFLFEICLLVWLISIAVDLNRDWLWFIIGFICAYSILTRPSYIFYAPFIIAVFFLVKKRPERFKTQILSFIIGFAITLAPWSLYTKIKHVPFTGTKNDTGTLSAGFYPGLVHKDPRYYGFPYKDPAGPDIHHDRDKALKQLMVWVKKDPGKYLQWFFVGKPLVLWQWDIIQGQGDIFVYRTTGSSFIHNQLFITLKSIYKTLHPAMFFTMIAGCLVILYKRDSFVNLVIVSIIAYFFAVHIVFVSLPRYSIPLRPLMIYLDVYFLSWFFKYLSEKKTNWDLSRERC